MNQLPMIAEDPQHGMHHFQQHQHAHHQQQQQQQQQPSYHHDTNESESNSDDDNSPSEHKMDQQSSGKLFTPHKQAAPLVIQWLEENYENYDEGTLPRSTVYSHYDLFCNTTNLERLNAASFGKLIRNVFPNLKTRRLGTRGNSKYHYYGIRVKTTSELNHIPSSSLKHDTHQPSSSSSSSSSSFGFNNTPGSSLAPTTGAGQQQLHASSNASSPSSTSSSSSSSTPLLVSVPGSSVPSGVKALQKQSGASAFKSAHILNPLSTPVSTAQSSLLDDDDLISNNTPEQFVAGTFGENSLSFQLPLFNFQTSSLKLGQTASSLQTTTEALVESLKLMMNNYRLFCQNFLDIAYRQVYPELEELCKTFWKNVHHFIKVMLHNESVVGVIIEKDEILFATILSTLLPSLLQPTKPSAQLKAFFKKFCNLMKTSLEGYPPEPFVSRKMQATRTFSNNVRRQLNLHSIGFDLSLLLKNPTSISKALIDFNNIDFDFVFQASPHTFSPCDLPIVRAIHDDIKASLSQPKDFEQWVHFLLDCLLKAMKKVTSFNPKLPSSSSASASEYSYESLIQAAQYITKTLSCFHLLLHSEVPSSRLTETSPVLLIYSFVIEFLMFVSPHLAKHQSIHILPYLSNQLPPNVIITRVSDLDHQAFTQQQQQQHHQQQQVQHQQHHQVQAHQQAQQHQHQQGQQQHQQHQQQQSHYGQQQQMPQQQFQHAQYLQQQQHVSQYPGADSQMYFSQGYPQQQQQQQQQQQRSQQHTTEGQSSYGNQVSMPSQSPSSILSQGFLVDRQHHQHQQQQQGQNFGDYSRLLSQPQNLSHSNQQQTQWSTQLPTPSITTDHLSLRSPFVRQDFPTPSYLQSNSTFSGSTLLPSTSSLSQQTSAPSLMSKLEDPFYSRSVASSSNPNNGNNNNNNNNNMFYQPTTFRSATGGSNSPPLLAAINGGASLLNTSAPPSTPPLLAERRTAIFPGDRLSNQSTSADQMSSTNNNNNNNGNTDNTSPPRSTSSVPPGAKSNMTFSSLSHRQYQGGYGGENEGSGSSESVPVSDRFSGFGTMDYGRPGSGNSGIFLFSTDPEQRASTGFLESPSGPSSVDLSSGPSDDPMSDKSKLYDRGSGSYSNSKLR